MADEITLSANDLRKRRDGVGRDHARVKSKHEELALAFELGQASAESLEASEREVQRLASRLNSLSLAIIAAGANERDSEAEAYRKRIRGTLETVDARLEKRTGLAKCIEDSLSEVIAAMGEFNSITAAILTDCEPFKSRFNEANPRAGSISAFYTLRAETVLARKTEQAIFDYLLGAGINWNGFGSPDRHPFQRKAVDVVATIESSNDKIRRSLTPIRQVAECSLSDEVLEAAA